MDSTLAHGDTAREAEVVVAPADPLTKDEIREVVGAKNVMGTCSG